MPSVTTILSATTPKEKREALQEWRDRVGHKKAQEITTEAAARGTRMHTYLERYVLDGVRSEEPGNPFAKPSWYMANSVIDKGLVGVDEFWGMEVPLYFPSVYAGTTDCIGVHKNSQSIIDFKQSNKYKKREWIEDYFLQLAAYAEAHNEVHGTEINKGVIMMAVKPAINESTGEITGDVQYLEYTVEGDEFQQYKQAWWRRVEEYYSRQALVNTAE